MNITLKEIENILGFEPDDLTVQQFNDCDLSYDDISDEELQKYVITFIDVLMSDIQKSGEHRINEWEVGWTENLINFQKSKNINDLIPKYHSKNRLVRWNQKMVNPKNKDFDYKLHILIVDSIIRKYLSTVDNIFEFGCGTGYHLLRLHEYFPDKKLIGADWSTASQSIINTINNIINTDIGGYNLNFFKPDYSIPINENTGIYTVAALEQIGPNFKEFVDFLLVKKPNICIHFEPIDELLDATKLLDNLTIKYFRKRKYLDGFLPYLQELERMGKIEIIKQHRTYTGSFFIEGHSLIIWKPL